MKQFKKMETEKMVLTAILAALIWVLQMFLQIPAGIFSANPVNMSLVPIVIGAAICGTKTGAILGLVSGIAVLASHGADLFLGWNFWATILIVLVKGTLCGVASGIVYNALKKVNKYVAVLVSAIACPAVNTGIFFLGSLVFFMKDIAAFAAEMGFGGSALVYIIVGFIGWNFLIEMGINLVLSPIIVRILNARKK